VHRALGEHLLVHGIGVGALAHPDGPVEQLEGILLVRLRHIGHEAHLVRWWLLFSAIADPPDCAARLLAYR
jgi:hypothetical protein